MSQALQRVGFTYDILEPTVAAEARDLASRMRAFESKVTTDAIAIGRDLIVMKEKVGHGNFGAWLAAEFAGVDRTARRYMSLAEAFGAKSDTVSVLPLTSAYVLAAKSVPEPVRASIIGRIEKGEPMTPHGVVSLIQSGRMEHRQKTNTRNARLRRQALRQPVDPKVAARQQRREERAEQERQQRWAERDVALTEAADLIRERLSAADIERLTDLLEAADASSFTLGRRLRGEREPGWVDPDLVEAIREAARDLSSDEEVG